ncbi:MAG TPA: hypothetical protein VFE37_26040 [Chloroflexota bacterium]|nr:hypothetical protein [Chloroflexota bacterium]
MSDQTRHIEDPPEIRWAGNRSLLLTLRVAMECLPTDPDRAADLLALAHADARQIIEDADLVIQAVRGNSPVLWQMLNELAQSIEGELEADDAAAEDEAGDGD